MNQELLRFLSPLTEVLSGIRTLADSGSVRVSFGLCTSDTTCGFGYYYDLPVGIGAYYSALPSGGIFYFGISVRR
jgi:hypothetical protein